MLIDSSPPPADPGPPRRVIEPDWHLWSWVILSVALFVPAAVVTGAAGVVLAFSGFFAALKALETWTGRYGMGLQEWRQ